MSLVPMYAPSTPPMSMTLREVGSLFSKQPLIFHELVGSSLSQALLLSDLTGIAQGVQKLLEETNGDTFGKSLLLHSLGFLRN